MSVVQSENAQTSEVTRFQQHASLVLYIDGGSPSNASIASETFQNIGNTWRMMRYTETSCSLVSIIARENGGALGRDICWGRCSPLSRGIPSAWVSVLKARAKLHRDADYESRRPPKAPKACTIRDIPLASVSAFIARIKFHVGCRLRISIAQTEVR